MVVLSFGENKTLRAPLGATGRCSGSSEYPVTSTVSDMPLDSVALTRNNYAIRTHGAGLMYRTPWLVRRDGER